MTDDKKFYEKLHASMKENRMKDYYCRFCGRKLFRARYIDGTGLNLTCPKCKTPYIDKVGKD